MIYSRQFIESCREHKPITGTALHGSLDAPDLIPMGGSTKKDVEGQFGDVVISDFVSNHVWREE